MDTRRRFEEMSESAAKAALENARIALEDIGEDHEADRLEGERMVRDRIFGVRAH